MLTVKMFPKLSWFENEESGIKRVVEAYCKYLPQFDIKIVDGQNDPCDIIVAHAGTMTNPDVAHTHGLYWSADYSCTRAELHTNARVVESVRNAREVTVPSRWVQKTFERDMKFSPHIVEHGIDAEKWKHDYDYEPYVLWNKNRDRDVCTPEHMVPLASSFQNVEFITTFAPDKSFENITEIGIVPHEEMKELIQRAGIYLSTTKETFGIGTLEAMASGVPVLGFAYGGNLELVEHGVNGYLATPGNYDDLKKGLAYCMEHREILGKNGQETVQEFTWEKACKKVADIYHQANERKDPSVSVIVPAYNYEEKVERAINSAIHQDFPPEEVIVVDDGSTDNTEEVVKEIARKHNIKERDTKIRYIWQENSGVAVARNRGIKSSKTKYVCCLDADDKIAPEFLDVCVNALEKDDSLGIAYTGLYHIKPDGEEGNSKWPDEWDFDQQLKRLNQVPTCNVMRKEMFDRLGGYRQRYAPHGAGSEDAEFWLRSGAYGWKAEKVDERGLFIYSWLSGRVSGNPEYHELDWTAWHPWIEDGLHPFASYATPRNKISHLVRQYDSPEISVIIPVGPGHGDVLVDALDSLEAQTYRNWEVIVVFDSLERIDYYKKAYPYIKIVVNEDGSPHGAGWARNRGVEKAEAGLLLFLDADDWLYPNALDAFMYAWQQTGEIIYSDYVAKGKMSKEDAESFDEDRLLQFDEKREEGVVRFYSHDFSCAQAQSQPKDPDKPYIWNLITSLVPKLWHKEIEGFDETLESWEDWDYWIRMAKAGKCFHRIPEDLIVYRFYTGKRRARGRELGENLIQYLDRKYKDIENMGCGCKNKEVNHRTITSPSQRMTSIRGDTTMDIKDEDAILVRYEHPNRGQHRVYGAATGNFYGYHGQGAEFLVDKRDIAAHPQYFVPIEQPATAPQEKEKETPPPEPITEKRPTQTKADTTEDVGDQEERGFEELSDIPGVSDRIASEMNALGINDFVDLGEADTVELMNIKGVGEKTAIKMVMEASRAVGKN